MASSHVAKVTAGGVTGRRIASSIYGRCETAAATAAKTVNLINDAGTTETWAAADLFHGLTIYVQFVNTNTVANPTLNVNSSGAKPIYRYGTTVPSTNVTNSWNAGSVLGFTYDTTVNTSGCWIMHDWLNNNSTYANYSFGNGYGTCTTAQATTAKVGTYSNYALVTGGIVAIKFTYAVPAGSTLNINSKGAKSIYLNGAAIKAGVINAGNIATFIYDGTYYQVISVSPEALTTADIDAAFGTVSGLVVPVDYVSEQGTSGIWTYRKWYSGMIEMWGNYSGNVTNYASYSGYYQYYADVNYPFTLTSVFNWQASVIVQNQMTTTTIVPDQVTTSKIRVYGQCPQSGTQPFRAKIYVVGNWK